MTQAEEDLALRRLYTDFAAADLAPLWTQRDDLMPMAPAPAARPHRWRWDDILPLAARAGELVPVGRGGERRAIALANPGCNGAPYATSTLWAAVQYLGPGEAAPAHRHSQNAFRFVLEGEGVWTVVDGDPVAMRRGDLLLTAGWSWHAHHNARAEPMVWLDGLDIPLVTALDAEFFEFGPEEIGDRSTPVASRGERLWAHPGVRPLVAHHRPTSPLAAYRWEHTDAALREQLELEGEGQPGVASPGHAAIRFVSPLTGRDALPTLRTEMHRLRGGGVIPATRTVGSTVWQVFAGEGAFTVDDGPINDGPFDVRRGDLVAVPSWRRYEIEARTDLDLFVFGDAPVHEALHLDRSEANE